MEFDRLHNGRVACEVWQTFDNLVARLYPAYVPA